MMMMMMIKDGDDDDNNNSKASNVVDQSSLALEFVCSLGRGGFGSVALIRDSKNRLHAEKSCPIAYMESLKKEHRIMLRFRNHPRIVQTTNPHLHIGINLDHCYMYMEFASKGTLHDFISNFGGRPIPEVMIRRAALMILQGLHALHTRGYVHCDLKPANVLLFPSKIVGEPWDLKLADFGLSKEPSCTNPRPLTGGTKEYMPPESLGLNRAKMVGPAVDIWALGCVVLQMFGGCPVKMGECYRWSVPRIASPLANHFLKRCMELQPSRRPTAADLLKHPFL
ncbi:Protein kinase superfamily protein [Raphanus sativus]|uniref:Mitogen-activated protein kinase kinase kinase 20-like n=1 Tax=Raphanus sativus TaxID=3726 RepID=A0A6J0N4A9_RAPSA|nr:mitogen-activated protein kinase kinase kinase 20-like [Raphanus sativus]KAJ4901639.1 Protein kinase superfamily protein [Raphanus sativus]